MTDLISRSKQGALLSWSPPAFKKSRFAIAGVFEAPGGVYVLDTFYNDTGSFPLHYVKGKITGSNYGPWSVGDVKFYEVETGDDAARGAVEWQNFVKTDPKRYAYEAMNDFVQKDGRSLLPQEGG